MRPSGARGAAVAAAIGAAVSVVASRAIAQEARAPSQMPAPSALPSQAWPYAAPPWWAVYQPRPERSSTNTMVGGIVIWALGGLATWLGAIPLLVCVPPVPSRQQDFCGDAYVQGVAKGIVIGGQLFSVVGIPFFLLGTRPKPRPQPAPLPAVRVSARGGGLVWTFE